MAQQQKKQRVQQPQQDPQEVDVVKKLPRLKIEHMQRVDPMSDNQSKAFHGYHKEKNLILSGSAGTGKTFIAMALALKEVLEGNGPYKKVVIIRSIVPTRDIGFLPGDEAEKKEAYMMPYIEICNELFKDKLAFQKLQDQNYVIYYCSSLEDCLNIEF